MIIPQVLHAQRVTRKVAVASYATQKRRTSDFDSAKKRAMNSGVSSFNLYVPLTKRETIQPTTQDSKSGHENTQNHHHTNVSLGPLKLPNQSSFRLSSTVDEHFDIDLKFLHTSFPGLSYNSLSNVYSANKGDLDATVDILIQLQEVDNGNFDIDLKFLHMSFPGLSYNSLSNVYLANKGDLEATVGMLIQLQEVDNINFDIDLEFLHMSFPGLSYKSLSNVYLANKGDLEATVYMLIQLQEVDNRNFDAYGHDMDAHTTPQEEVLLAFDQPRHHELQASSRIDAYQHDFDAHTTPQEVLHGFDQPLDELQVVKNKLAPAMKKADLEIVFEKGFHCENEVLDLACEHGVIMKEGDNYLIEDEVFGNGNAAERYLSENDEVLNKASSRIDAYQHDFDAHTTPQEVLHGFDQPLDELQGYYKFDAYRHDFNAHATPQEVLHGFDQPLDELQAFGEQATERDQLDWEKKWLFSKDDECPLPNDQYMLNDDDKLALAPNLLDSNKNYDDVEIRPPKKRRRVEDGEDCKGCHCKKSQCLKLYCECFVAGMYCTETCSCQGCYNKDTHRDVVRESHKNIESRNPLAFAPKLIQSGDEHGVVSGKRRASARHRSGCNCEKSQCLKNYCECYQGGVGCSTNCRCKECKNEFGTRDRAAIQAARDRSKRMKVDTGQRKQKDIWNQNLQQQLHPLSHLHEDDHNQTYEDPPQLRNPYQIYLPLQVQCDAWLSPFISRQ